ncbi:MAG: hypothetical protein DHS20C18_29560 [Saprospiraceae bacterium]|nr:MAG: hypothetical protein DHS20C18_29560 [Saprospiraceae bacterium]
MKKKIFTLILFLTTTLTISFAQISWDGGGDGTSWNDPLNWNTDLVPPADSLVTFEIDVVVTGTMSNVPAQVKIAGNTNVTLDLDMTIGNGVIDEHALILNDSCNLTLGTPGNPRTIFINAPESKNAVAVFNSAEMANMIIAEGTTLMLDGGQIGINFSNENSTLTNNGNIVGGNLLRDGIKVGGTVINNGNINFTEPTRDGIWLTTGGNLTNSETGVITISKPSDDCIEVKGDGVFTNAGSLDLVVKDDAGSGESCIAVGTSMEAGTFINTGLDVRLDGGLDTVGRAIFVNDLGILTNSGTLTLSGGDEASRLFVKGVATNEINAILDLTDGRFNVNATGSFTNNGLIKTTRDGSGGFNAGTAVNNGFFNYLNSNGFASGSGNTTDNGISLNNASQTTIDAGGACTIDIAEAIYDWFEEDAFISATDATGSLTLPANSLTADPAILSTSLEGVFITVQNFCPEALVVSGVFTPEAVIQLKLYPSLMVGQHELTLEIPELLQANEIVFDVFDMGGQKIKSTLSPTGAKRVINISAFNPGTYIIRSRGTEKSLVGRFVVVR